MKIMLLPWQIFDEFVNPYERTNKKGNRNMFWSSSRVNLIWGLKLLFKLVLDRKRLIAFVIIAS